MSFAGKWMELESHRVDRNKANSKSRILQVFSHAVSRPEIIMGHECKGTVWQGAISGIEEGERESPGGKENQSTYI
jgi:hypothetical protein